jgi:hypothetical protein
MATMLDQDRSRGALLGLAVGDALGTLLEFLSPGSFEPLTDRVGGGPFRLAAGPGVSGIPAHWLGRLAMREAIVELADALYAQAATAVAAGSPSSRQSLSVGAD